MEKIEDEDEETKRINQLTLDEVLLEISEGFSNFVTALSGYAESLGAKNEV
jgi:hypothetical protein